MELSEEGIPNKSSANTDPLKNKTKARAKKRKRDCSTSTDEDDILPENTLEFENNVHASAIKNNLDDVSVKKILKKVVTNDHVLALVKLREEEELAHSDINVQPKLTRAKAKELMKISPKTADSRPWNLELTPIKQLPVKTRPEVTALIAQEQLPDDEDDEEYRPTHDDVPSDDDHATCSDIDSQPRTPATPLSATKSSPKVVTDGPFKVPQETVSQVKRKLELEEDATIALRTRSKLSLSGTPIEHIESCFVPPDDLPVPDVDDLWSDFLEGCLNPVSTTRHEDDDETDPEYSVAADPDAVDEDEDAFENSIIKISKKEINDLVNELFSVMPEQELTPLLNEAALENGNELNKPQWEGKQEPLSEEDIPRSLSARLTFEGHDNVRISIGKSEPDDHHVDEPVLQETVTEARPVAVLIEEKQAEEETEYIQPPPVVQSVLNAPPETVHVEVDSNLVITPQQILILEQQLRMHIQLSASNFLQLFVNPAHWTYGPKYKEYLETLNKMGEINPDSIVNVCNLKPAVELIHSWETTVSQDTPENAKMVEFIQSEADRGRRRSLANSFFIGEFPEMFKKVIANSSVFLYPFLLPPVPFRPDLNKRRSNYLKSEEQLIVLGLDQFWTYVEDNPDIFHPPTRRNPRHRWGLTATIELVCKYMFPWVTMKTMAGHIQCTRKLPNLDHPIKRFFADRYVEPTKHKLMPFNPTLTLYEQPENEMPKVWVRYLAKSSKRFRSHLNKKKRGPGFETPDGVEIGPGTKLPEVPKRPLPIDFIKTIPSTRISMVPIIPASADKVDIHIESKESSLIPNVYQVVNTEAGAILMPIGAQSTADTKPIIKAEQVAKSNTDKAKPNQDLLHCSCCFLLRKICKYRQKRITEYIKKFNVRVTCPCKSVKHPLMSNKLKLLLKCYKGASKQIFEELRMKIDCLQEKKEKETNVCDTAVARDAKDLAFVTMFQIRLSLRQNKVRNQQVKRNLFKTLAQYNPESGNPVKLMNEIYEACHVDLVEMYKEFLGFLTAAQAEEIDKFKDYFVLNCMEDLVKKTEEVVPDKTKRKRILEYLMRLSRNNPLSCVMCSELLDRMRDYPELARYCFSLFPHRRKDVIEASREWQNKVTETQKQIDNSVITCENLESPPTEIDDSNDNVDSTQTRITNSEKENICNAHTQRDASTTDGNMSVNSLHTHTNGDVNVDIPHIKKERDISMNRTHILKDGLINDNEVHSRKKEALNVDITRTPRDEDTSIHKQRDDDMAVNRNSDSEMAIDEMECEGRLTICEDSDHESESIKLTYSDEEPAGENADKDSACTTPNDIHLKASTKSENIKSSELTVIKSEILENLKDQDEEPRLYFVPDSWKLEPIGWKRDEDKLILEVLKEHLTPEERKDKTIIEIIEEKNIPQLISDSLSHKSLTDVRGRIFYLLQILVIND